MPIYPDLNVALLDETLDWVRKNGHLWNQTDYRCESGVCFAGAAVELAGNFFPYPPSDHGTYGHVGDPGRDSAPRPEIAQTPDGTRFTIDWLAVYELGLTETEAEVLFDGTNTVADLEDAVSKIKAGWFRQDGEVKMPTLLVENDGVNPPTITEVE